jgi:hypothetical protein
MGAEASECAVVAVYGLAPERRSLQSFYREITAWMAEVGHPPGKVSVHGTGHSGKPIAARTAEGKLQKSGFKGVTDLTLFALGEGARIPLRDYLIMASCSTEGSYAFVAGRTSVVSLSSTSLLPVLHSLSDLLRPSYGIGFTRESRLGPAMYAIGMSEGLGPSGREYAESLEISRWGDLGMVREVFREGFLRDVYPWNLLNQAQLDRQVDGLSLREWIAHDPERGALTPASIDRWLWEVSSRRVSAVGESLRRAGVLFEA